MEKPSAVPAFLIFLCLGIIVPVLMFFAGKAGLDTEKNYKENGRLVECTVVQAIKVGKTTDATVEYTDENGQVITAHATANKKTYVGDKFEGYVLPGTPNEVYCPADKVLKFILLALFSVFVVIGWIMPFSYIASKKKYDLLMQNGKDTMAELVEYDRKNEVTLYAWFKFTSDTGKEHKVRLFIPANSAEPNAMYSIKYCELPNGDVKADITDDRLKRRI
ncbi:MAG: hypothetical protein IJ062_01185 [Firmicutes bacterium]|nr:hypothetical protein [Bacillota bacterium]